VSLVCRHRLRSRGACGLSEHGSYEAPLGGIEHLTFSYSTYLYPHVDYVTIEERHAGSELHNYFPGDALVQDGRFAFAGSYAGKVLLVAGAWTTADTVKGTVTLPNGTRKEYSATRIVNNGGGGFGALPPRTQGVHQAEGHYTSPRVRGKDIEFTYHGTPEAAVSDFRTVGHGVTSTSRQRPCATARSRGRARSTRSSR
jgi:hypothetical protein